MDALEACKENVQPIKTGRKLSVLSKSLTVSGSASAASKKALDDERAEAMSRHEEAIEATKGSEDPLAAWVAYVSWARQEYATVTGNNPLIGILERATREFVGVEILRNDLRYVKLWIAYADAMKDGGDIFKFMYSHRIGEDTALFYLGWAHVAESSGNFAFAEKVYTKGIARKATPLDRLQQRHSQFMHRMSKLWLKSAEERSAGDPFADVDLAKLSASNGFGPSKGGNDENRGPLNSISATAAAKSHREPEAKGNRAPKPLPPMAPTVGKAPLHNFAVFVDEENGPGKLAGHLEDPTPSGGWGSLGTEKERRKENQGPVSRVWSDAQLPTHAGVHTFNRTAPSTQPQATFDVFEDDIDNSSSASTGGVRAESEGLRVRPAGEISTSEALAANPLRGFGTLRSSVSRPQPPLAQPPPTAPSHPPTAPLRDKGKEAVKGEKEGNEPEPIAEYLPLFSIGAGLSFEELRARDYRVKSPKQASAGSATAQTAVASKQPGMTTVGKPKRALSPVATPAITLLQSDALKQFDADDVTVNTRLAMDELEDVFCSPTAKVKLTTAKTTARSCGRTLAPVPMTSFSVFEDEPSPGCEKQPVKKAATAAPRPIVPSTTTAFKPHAAPAAPAKFSIFCDEEPEPAPKSSGFRIFCDDDCLDVKDLKPKVGLKPPAAALGVYVDEKFDESGNHSPQPPHVYVREAGTLKSIPSLRKGSLVSGRYKVVQLLGKGSFGAVYEAVDSVMGQSVALKVVHSDSACRQEFDAMTLCCKHAESTATNSVCKPLTVLAPGDLGGSALFGFTMELLPSKTLQDVINSYRCKNTTAPEPLCRALLSRMLNVIKVVHTAGIIHCDIKPDNWLVSGTTVSHRKELSDGPDLTLIDFGCCVNIHTLSVSRARGGGGLLTGRTGVDSFECPAMLTGKPWSFEADLYALAGCVHCLLYGDYMTVIEAPTGSGSLSTGNAFKFTTRQKPKRYWPNGLWEDVFQALLHPIEPEAQDFQSAQQRSLGVIDTVQGRLRRA